jgi:hypothetical protein
MARVRGLILNSDIREAVAIYLYGEDYTIQQLKGIAIFADGRWYKYPSWGTYHITVFNRIAIKIKISP